VFGLFSGSRSGCSRARKRAYENLVGGLEHETIAGPEALIAVGNDRDRTLLAWLREWLEAPGQKNLVGVVERLQVIRKLGLGQDREQRIPHGSDLARGVRVSLLQGSGD